MFRWLTKGSTLTLRPSGLIIGGPSSPGTDKPSVFDWGLIRTNPIDSSEAYDAPSDQLQTLRLALSHLSRATLVVDDSLLRLAVATLDKPPLSIEDVTRAAMKTLEPSVERSSRVTAAPAFAANQWIVCAVPPKVDQWVTLLEKSGVKVTAMVPSWIDQLKRHGIQESEQQLIGYCSGHHVVLIELDQTRIVKLTQRFLPEGSQQQRDEALVQILDEAVSKTPNGRTPKIALPGDDSQDRILAALSACQTKANSELADA